MQEVIYLSDMMLINPHTNEGKTFERTSTNNWQQYGENIKKLPCYDTTCIDQGRFMPSSIIYGLHSIWNVAQPRNHG